MTLQRHQVRQGLSAVSGRFQERRGRDNQRGKPRGNIDSGNLDAQRKVTLGKWELERKKSKVNVKPQKKMLRDNGKASVKTQQHRKSVGGAKGST